MPEPTTVGALLDVAERVLSDSTHIFEDHDNRMEAEDIFAFCLGTTADELGSAHELSRPQRDRYLALVARRAAGEPLPHLTGHIEFYGLDLRVRPGAFVPRPSSELLVDEALRLLGRRRDPIVVDVCTGAGPIAMAIADERPKADVWGTDIDRGGLAQGRRNAKRLEIDNVNFRYGDMYGSLPKRFRGNVDVIAGHVPYVPMSEIADLPSEVREHEPIYTLADESGDDLGLMRRAVVEAPQWLKPGGWLLLEMSDDIAVVVKRLFRKVGFTDVSIASDEDDLSVIVEGCLPR